VQVVTKVKRIVCHENSKLRRLGPNAKSESRMFDRKLTDAIKHFGRVVMACKQGYAKQLYSAKFAWHGYLSSVAMRG